MTLPKLCDKCGAQINMENAVKIDEYSWICKICAAEAYQKIEALERWMDTEKAAELR